jgi:hypothetical protein
MTHQKTVEYFQSLLKELIALNQETEWAEFKHNSIKPEYLKDEAVFWIVLKLMD